jgi:hypothetical protein
MSSDKIEVLYGQGLSNYTDFQNAHLKEKMVTISK